METLREKAEKFLHGKNTMNTSDVIDLMVDFAESQNQWIPVSERLPLEGESVLCINNDEEFGIDWWSNHPNWINQLQGPDNFKIEWTHWKQLTPPNKGEIK